MTRRLDRTTCEETFRRLDDYLDRQLSDEEIRLVEAHLRECAMCSREFVFEAEVIRSVRQKLQRVSVPPGLLDRIIGQIARSGGGDEASTERRDPPTDA
jgi:anti-sigma factor (TIGR02949 family)